MQQYEPGFDSAVRFSPAVLWLIMKESALAWTAMRCFFLRASNFHRSAGGLFTVMMSSRHPGRTSTPVTAPALNLRVCVEECARSTVSAPPPPNPSLANVNVDCDMSMWQLVLFLTSMTNPGALAVLLRGAGAGESGSRDFW